VIEYAGNCGNLTAAVGPYAIDEGLVGPVGTGTEAHERVVTLENLNTGVQIRARVPVTGGRAAWQGTCAIDGVPGTGAPIVTDYLDPAGSVTGKLFPTGAPRDTIGGLEVSIVDVATPYAFVRAADLGLDGSEAPADLNARPDLLATLEGLRTECGYAIGLASAAVPRLVLVSAPARGDDADLRVQVTSMQKVHHATPVTGALCTAAAVSLPGTVPEATAAPGGTRRPGLVVIRHPKGRIEATVDLDDGGQVRSAGVVRTARRLLAGTAYVAIR
jgi:2-methylaconitate cis-trans-isomerase PrpF